MPPLNVADAILFLSWLALGITIEMLGFYLDLYHFVHWALPILVAVGLFGLAAPLVQKMFGQRSLVFATVVFVSATTIEFLNATSLHWWTFNTHIRENFSNELLLALGTSSPLFFISYGMSFSFRSQVNSDVMPRFLVFREYVIGSDGRVYAFCTICVLLLIALGRYGNADYVLRPLGVEYLAPIAPLEPRTKYDIGVINAVLVFLFQAVTTVAAVIVAGRVCSLKAEKLAFGVGRLPIAQGLPLLVFLTVVPMPAFIQAGLDPGMNNNYPFIQSFSGVVSFVGYQIGYLLFFFTVEVLFRSLLFLGMASVLTQAEKCDGEPDRKHLVSAGIVSCICYIVWHLGKPIPELFGALLWGPLACLIVWQTRSIIYLLVPHWLWNVLLDAFVTLKQHSLAPP